jgi:cytochrome c-type biogenesis protein CcmF
MVLVTIVLGLLTAMTQYFKYKDTTRKYLWSKLLIPTILAAVLGALASIFGDINYDKFGLGYLVAIHIALWASIYTVVANAFYLGSVLKWKMKAAGSSITHFGFGLMLVGILISASKKELISQNLTGILVKGLRDNKGKEDNPLENMTLIYNTPIPMGKYMVTYLGDSAEPKNNKVYFKINFIETDTVTNEVKDQFTITPNAFMIKSETGSNLSSNPGAKHYLTSDVFVYITSWMSPENAKKDTSEFKYTRVSQGDTVFYSNGYVLVEDLVRANKNDNKDLPLVDSAWLSKLNVVSSQGVGFKSTPGYFVQKGFGFSKADTVMEQSLVLNLEKRGKDDVYLGVKESASVMRYITLKAFRFPLINLLWLGTVIMVIGFMISMYFRLKSKLYAI